MERTQVAYARKGIPSNWNRKITEESSRPQFSGIVLKLLLLLTMNEATATPKHISCDAATPAKRESGKNGTNKQRKPRSRAKLSLRLGEANCDISAFSVHIRSTYPCHIPELLPNQFFNLIPRHSWSIQMNWLAAYIQQHFQHSTFGCLTVTQRSKLSAQD